MHRHGQTRHQNTQRAKSPPAPSPQKSRTHWCCAAGQSANSSAIEWTRDIGSVIRKY